MRPSITINNYTHIIYTLCMNKWWPMFGVPLTTRMYWITNETETKTPYHYYIFNVHSFIAFVSFYFHPIPHNCCCTDVCIEYTVFNTWSFTIKKVYNTTKTRLLLTSQCVVCSIINKYQWMRIQRTPKKSPSLLQNHCVLIISFWFNKLVRSIYINTFETKTEKTSFISFNF